MFFGKDLFQYSIHPTLQPKHKDYKIKLVDFNRIV